MPELLHEPDSRFVFRFSHVQTTSLSSEISKSKEIDHSQCQCQNQPYPEKVKVCPRPEVRIPGAHSFFVSPEELWVLVFDWLEWEFVVLRGFLGRGGIVGWAFPIAGRCGIRR